MTFVWLLFAKKFLVIALTSTFCIAFCSAFCLEALVRFEPPYVLYVVRRNRLVQGWELVHLGINCSGLEGVYCKLCLLT